MQETFQQLQDDLVTLGGTITYKQYDSAKWWLGDSFVGAGKLYTLDHPDFHSEELWLPVGEWTFAQGDLTKKAESERLTNFDEAMKTFQWFVSECRKRRR